MSKDKKWTCSQREVITLIFGVTKFFKVQSTMKEKEFEENILAKTHLDSSR